jgi:hypothetical protein
MAPISAGLPMIAVVQQNDIATPQPAQVLNHWHGRLWFPIPRHSASHHNTRSSTPPDNSIKQRA